MNKLLFSLCFLISVNSFANTINISNKVCSDVMGITEKSSLADKSLCNDFKHDLIKESVLNNMGTKYLSLKNMKQQIINSKKEVPKDLDYNIKTSKRELIPYILTESLKFKTLTGLYSGVAILSPENFMDLDVEEKRIYKELVKNIKIQEVKLMEQIKTKNLSQPVLEFQKKIYIDLFNLTSQYSDLLN